MQFYLPNYWPILCFADILPAPEINISPVHDTMSGSPHFVPVTRNSCRSSVCDILLKFENLPIILTGRKRILLVTQEIVPDTDQWPMVISCPDLTKLRYKVGNIWRNPWHSYRQHILWKAIMLESFLTFLFGQNTFLAN